MASLRITFRQFVLVLISVYLLFSVQGQEYFTSLPQECESLVFICDPFQLCGAYRHPWPSCAGFCFDLLLPFFLPENCPEAGPSFDLLQKIWVSCGNVCDKTINHGKVPFRQDENRGFLIYLVALNHTADVEISSEAKYYELRAPIALGNSVNDCSSDGCSKCRNNGGYCPSCCSLF